MPYVTSIEQMGIEEGEKKGREEAEKEGLERQRSILQRQLTRKLGVLSESAIAQVSLLSVDQLDELAEALFDFNTVDELEDWLRNLE
jgi:flagellar biosynthesis/type III secretory pathway protein FliH